MKKIIKRLLYVSAVIVTTCLFTSQVLYVNANAADDANYTNTTIYAKDSKGNVIGSMTGMFTKGTTLVIENDDSKLGYADIARKYFDADEFSGKSNPTEYAEFIYGVNVTNGTYKGKVVVSFNIGNYVEDSTTGQTFGNKYNGMNAKTVVHLKSQAKDAIYNNTVNNGIVSFTLDYPPLLERTPFIIGVQLNNLNQKPSEQQTTQPQTQTKQPQVTKKQPTYKGTTLNASVNNEKVDVKGSFVDGSKLSVSKITKDSDNYKKLDTSMSNNNVIGAYDVTVPKGAYNGGLNVKFTVDSKYANKEVTIKHLLSNGNIESATVKVAPDNTVEMKVSSLSPFMIFQQNSSILSSLSTQQYIEIGGGIILIIVIIGCTIAIVKSRKHN